MEVPLEIHEELLLGLHDRADLLQVRLVGESRRGFALCFIILVVVGVDLNLDGVQFELTLTC